MSDHPSAAALTYAHTTTWADANGEFGERHSSAPGSGGWPSAAAMQRSRLRYYRDATLSNLSRVLAVDAIPDGFRLFERAPSNPQAGRHCEPYTVVVTEVTIREVQS